MGFICPFCYTTLDIATFSKFFRHITIYHQNEPRFQLTCNLNKNCGIVYRTYSGYKSHVYRCHTSLLYSLENLTCNMNPSVLTGDQQEDTTLDADADLIYDNNENQMYQTIDDISLDLLPIDNDNAFETINTLCSTINNPKTKSVIMLDIKKIIFSIYLTTP